MHSSSLYAKGVERLWEMLNIELLFSLKGSKIYTPQIRDHSAPRLTEQKKSELFIGWNLNSKFVLIPQVRSRILYFDGSRFCYATFIVCLFNAVLQYSVTRSKQDLLFCRLSPALRVPYSDAPQDGYGPPLAWLRMTALMLSPDRHKLLSLDWTVW